MNGATTTEYAATIERASAANSAAARTRLSQQVDRSLRSFTLARIDIDPPELLTFEVAES